MGSQPTERQRSARVQVDELRLEGTPIAGGALAWSRAAEAARLCPWAGRGGTAAANQTAANAVVGPEESGRVRQAGMGKATRIKQQNARDKLKKTQRRLNGMNLWNNESVCHVVPFFI